jgi:hypothetical protein
MLAIGFGLSGIACESEAVAQEEPVYYVYLAGPEVFLDDAVAAGAEKKEIISRMSSEENWPFRLEGLYPLDNEIPNFMPDPETGIVSITPTWNRFASLCRARQHGPLSQPQHGRGHRFRNGRRPRHAKARFRLLRK